MKTIFKKGKGLLIGALGLFAISSCTKDFKAMNTNPSLITQAQAAGDFQYIGGYFPDLEENIFSTIDYVYQLQQNLNADVYSGYMMSADPFGGPNNTNYFMKDGWNGQAFSLGYLNIMKDWYTIKQKARPQDAHFVAVALILKVEGMHRITDIYGPIPYSAYNLTAAELPYDSQQAVYTRFFAELDTATTVLSAYVKANPGATPFAAYDFVYAGDYKQWLKFANTLRLRLAMRLSYVDPTLAQAQAEKAVADPNGLLTAVADDAKLNQVNGLGYQNPLWNITNAYGDISMGAPAESILKGYNDPREAVYYLPSTAVAGVEKGIRNGIDNSTYSYADYSLLNVLATTPLNWMFASESYFLRAEGALRGWNMGGTAQSFYEAGITLSFQERGVAMPSGYLADATSTAEPYVDTHNATNSVPAGSPYLNNVTIAWSNTDSQAIQLQRIITQKWIAIYPDGEEAWCDQRRTGYPQLMPVVVNNSVGGSISTSKFIRRLPYPSSESTNNPVNYAKAVSLLNGPDVGGTNLWWDARP